MSDSKFPPRKRLLTSEQMDDLSDLIGGEHFLEMQRKIGVEYISLAEHAALVKAARAEAFEEAAGWFDADDNEHGNPQVFMYLMTKAKAARTETEGLGEK